MQLLSHRDYRLKKFHYRVGVCHHFVNRLSLLYASLYSLKNAFARSLKLHSSVSAIHNKINRKDGIDIYSADDDSDPKSYSASAAITPHN